MASFPLECIRQGCDQGGKTRFAVLYSLKEDYSREPKIKYHVDESCRAIRDRTMSSAQSDFLVANLRHGPGQGDALPARAMGNSFNTTSNGHTIGFHPG